MYSSISLTIFVILVTLVCPRVVVGQVETLLQYNVDPSTITVSGISSGGAMATQFHFAHSKDIKGCGMFAGGPFNCAYGGGLVVAAECMQFPSLINTSRLIRDTNLMASNGVIDDLSNIIGSKVYVWHGSVDSVVRPVSGKKAAELYEHYGADLKTEFTYEAEHGQPTHNYGGPCERLNSDMYFANKCDYMGAFEMLNHLYDNSLIRPQVDTNGTGQVAEFSQAEFFPDPENPPIDNSISDEGYLYVPEACQDGLTQCRLHIAFHGCKSNKEFMDDIYVTRTGYAETADMNNIIVLFPQTANIAANTNGCWDWYGYLGNQLYATKEGFQIVPVKKMVDRIVYG